MTGVEVTAYPSDFTQATWHDDGGRGPALRMLREATAVWSNAARGLVYVLAGAAGIDRDTRIGWFN